MKKQLNGIRFSRLLVLSENGRNDAGSVLWECKCDCGNICITSSRSLIRGNTKSCGCLNTESRQIIGRNNKKDLLASSFGRLTVIGDAGRDKYGQVKWLCKCNCGNEVIILANSLRRGLSKSCGCLRSEVSFEANLKHGGWLNNKATSEYNIWLGIKSRCINPNNPRYNDYGGRGIMICDRWINSFENFISDMGPRPSLRHSIDRYPNNDGNYEPNNCQWRTWLEQNSNRRNNRKIEYNGKIMILSEWGRFFGVTGCAVGKQLKKKSFEQVYSYYVNN